MKEKTKTNKSTNQKSTGVLFSSILQEMLRHAGNDKFINTSEPLAHMDYDIEVKMKHSALLKYWRMNKLPGEPSPLLPSPRGRFYRTTTKRKVIISDVNIIFTLGIRDASRRQNFVKSLLEPEEHSIIYEFLVNKINEPAYKLVGRSLNYVIIRGSYSEFTVIFNVHTLNAEIVRKIRLLSELLKSVDVNIISSFIFLDPSRSDYYLENERPVNTVSFKKLFGPDKIFLKSDNRKYSYHPTSFSQINESVIPLLLREAKRMLRPEKSQWFYDLYCGYGLFSLFMADEVCGCTGIDIEGESIKSAIVNASFHPSKNKIKFIPVNITGSNLQEILPSPTKDEVFLLDPPRPGTESGVIEVVSERNPVRILHIFCGIEQIKRETQEWEKQGYYVKEVQPIDMFPGTLNIEILILLEPLHKITK